MPPYFLVLLLLQANIIRKANYKNFYIILFKKNFLIIDYSLFYNIITLIKNYIIKINNY